MSSLEVEYTTFLESKETSIKSHDTNLTFMKKAPI